LAHTTGKKIKHSANGGVQKVGPYKVDGYFKDENTGEVTVAEYNGCFFHGDPHCYPSLRHTSLDGGESLEQRYDRTVKKAEYIRSLKNTTLIEIWECEWDKQVKKNKDIQQFIKTHCANLYDGLIPKLAFKGGRTECFRSLYKCSEKQEISYLDITSLYPWVMARKNLPVGMPRVYKNNFPELDKVHGLVDCTILPPSNLKLPILPFSCNSKLLFGLCRTCMEETNNNDSNHTEKEREFR